MVVIEQQNDGDLENNEASKDFNVGDILRAPRSTPFICPRNSSTFSADHSFSRFKTRSSGEPRNKFRKVHGSISEDCGRSRSSDRTRGRAFKKTVIDCEPNADCSSLHSSSRPKFQESLKNHEKNYYDDKRLNEDSIRWPLPRADSPKPANDSPESTNNSTQPTTESQPTNDSPKPTADSPKPTIDSPQPTNDSPQKTADSLKLTNGSSNSTSSLSDYGDVEVFDVNLQISEDEDSPQPTIILPQPMNESQPMNDSSNLTSTLSNDEDDKVFNLNLQVPKAEDSLAIMEYAYTCMYQEACENNAFDKYQAFLDDTKQKIEELRREILQRDADASL